MLLRLLLNWRCGFASSLCCSCFSRPSVSLSCGHTQPGHIPIFTSFHWLLSLCFSSRPSASVRSDYDDWRPALASLLQPIPFPKEWVFTHTHTYWIALINQSILWGTRAPMVEQAGRWSQRLEAWLLASPYPGSVKYQIKSHQLCEWWSAGPSQEQLKNNHSRECTNLSLKILEKNKNVFSSLMISSSSSNCPAITS